MTNYRDDFREAQKEAYWSLPRVLLYLAMVLIGVYGLGFLATGGDLAIYKFWAPKQENARRQVFENTQSYVQGKISYLASLRADYEAAPAGSDQRRAVRRMILSEAAQIDQEHLPADLSMFIDRLKGSSN